MQSFLTMFMQVILVSWFWVERVCKEHIAHKTVSQFKSHEVFGPVIRNSEGWTRRRMSLSGVNSGEFDDPVLSCAGKRWFKIQSFMVFRPYLSINGFQLSLDPCWKSGPISYDLGLEWGIGSGLAKCKFVKFRDDPTNRLASKSLEKGLHVSLILWFANQGPEYPMWLRTWKIKMLSYRPVFLSNIHL